MDHPKVRALPRGARVEVRLYAADGRKLVHETLETAPLLSEREARDMTAAMVEEGRKHLRLRAHIEARRVQLETRGLT